MGAEDGEAYKRLYRYMFDYLQQAGVHNLIWVWTSEVGDDDWYPGDEYVDIVARDGYPYNNTTHISQAADFWQHFLNADNGIVSKDER